MAMTTDTIVNQMKLNYDGTPSDSQVNAMTTLAQAIIDTIKEATLTYTTGLISGAPGDPVTGTLDSVTIS